MPPAFSALARAIDSKISFFASAASPQCWTEGVTSLAHLAGKGIFKEWDINNLFAQVYIDSESNTIAWNQNIDIDVLNLYLKIKNITFEQYQQLSYAPN